MITLYHVRPAVTLTQRDITAALFAVVLLIKLLAAVGYTVNTVAVFWQDVLAAGQLVWLDMVGGCFNWTMTGTG